ncbi:mannose-1-phosphate guanylyltransferase/mannose-6-phosphate isomerase [Methanococcoides sp. SA1]|uniref:mannose-1-phosphate guanylyltransferase n=1 Tax=Candidatus Desulfatifera sulfidica TaxID=2841691 RepID=A0A8J6TB29_9BACT|nr:mannose-1-phosphate guanylyltransferase/mannose-6-phosphate isomerase [Candidatus Desulfatifera sulfidica]NPE29462.1 mannose-1-phosphate guanylyltransferase/mannose-6-phosphate isomerase [Methanococcoides sp. SA1]
MHKIQPVILAGGTGSRLWPMSRELYPKQLLQLTGNLSLLQTTVERVSGLSGTLPLMVVVGEEHRFITRSQVEAMEPARDYTILLEPVERNTAPAICGAVEFAARDDDQIIVLILPADHLIRDSDRFAATVEEAVALAVAGSIVTFGIEPSRPETGYGYIERGEGRAVRSFKEKPDLATAEKYLASGNYFWNSGMFAFSARTFREEMFNYAPDIQKAMARAVAQGEWDGCFFRLDGRAMAESPSDSIDYALMEKTDRAVVVAADLGWSDIGSWQALWEVSHKDDDGNVLQGDVLVEGSRNCLVRADDILVAAVGLEDMLVVETGDAVLVSPLSRSQEVKQVVARLKRDRRKEFKVHRTVYRPWGSYTVLEQQPRYQIKRITVSPGEKLSLQMHHHRHEHWVIVTGTARITNGDETFLLHENQSTYIPAGVQHRFENPGVIDLEMIEVQNGSYLGEDDIIRFEDTYGRKK